MRFQTKVFLYSLVVALLSSLLAATFIYLPARKLVFGLMQTNVLSIAATTASLLDASEHEKIQTREDQSGEAYLRVEQQLRKARNANRRQDINVKFLYTMRPYPENPAIPQFVEPSTAVSSASTSLAWVIISGASYRTLTPFFLR